MQFRIDDRGISPVIGVILMAALTIALAAIVGATIMSDANEKIDGAETPNADFGFEFDQATGELTVSHESGESIDPDSLDIVGSDAWGDQFTQAEHGDEITSQDAVVLHGIEAGESIRVVYQASGGGSSSTIETYTTPASIPLKLSFDATKPPDGSAVTAFHQDFTQETNTNVMYEEKPDYIRWAEDEGAGNGVMEFSSPVEGSQNSVDITVKFQADSYEGSGAHLYAVDASGDTYTVFCDGSGYIDACGDKGDNWVVDKTVTINADDDIETVYLVTQLSNVKGEWWDEARLYHIEVTE